MKRFENKVALITGGSSGIGRSTAFLFGKEGAKVVIADTNEKEGLKAVRELEAMEVPVLFVKTDVSKSDDVQKLFDVAGKKFGTLDCAVNNAGILGDLVGIAHQTEQSFDRTIAVNLKGIWLCMKHELNMMLKNGRGSIVNVSSVNGIGSSPGAPIYSASKFAILGLTKSAAIEYGASGIRINAICPGAFPTSIFEKSFGRSRQFLEKAIPLKRIGNLDEVAESILWLCSENASYINGHALICDGGLLTNVL
ncbi:glucose 1-dehydrogenase [bacterium]|nr:glucose 1-dehydrogenase [bacterium]